MCKLKMHFIVLAAVIIALQTIGCSSSLPRKPIQKQPESTAAREEAPTDEAAYEELFVEMHGEILRELEKRESGGTPNNVLIEAQSIVKIAEEMYLEGNPFLAVKLLADVELLLK